MFGLIKKLFSRGREGKLPEIRPLTLPDMPEETLPVLGDMPDEAGIALPPIAEAPDRSADWLGFPNYEPLPISLAGNTEGQTGGAGVVIGDTHEPLEEPELLAEPGGDVFAVLLTQDGGVVGSWNTECTWTYTVEELDDETELGTTVTPEKPRYHWCAYWYAGETRTAPFEEPHVATSRYGLACYDNEGDLKLLIAYGEIAKDDYCP